MRFHLLGVPHTVTSHEYLACAYTQKVYKFGQMMDDHATLFHYGHEDSNLPCAEHVTVTTNDDLKKAYGSYDWRKEFFKYDLQDHAYQTFYKNAIREINARFEPGDFVLPFWGNGVRKVCDEVQNNSANKNALVVEPGIGYAKGHWARFKVWESYAMMHAYGGMDRVGYCNPDWYETVIPNYFDVSQFEFKDGVEKDDYFLFLGRVFEGKGVHIAIDIAQRLGIKLKIAGQKDPNFRIPNHPNIEYVGYADVETRKKLMSGAKGAFLPSTYSEPFGGVQIECLLSGTPTITTDWGAFTENNLPGLTGYRCRTFQDFISATQSVMDGAIDSSTCRSWGENFSLNRIRPRYLKYFQDVANTLDPGGWYKLDPQASIYSLKPVRNRLQDDRIRNA
jgi:glycosyltransferase involved in cell wall biosynthesis